MNGRLSPSWSGIAERLSQQLHAEPMGTLPSGIRDLMAEIGPKWGEDIGKHRNMVLAAYAPLLAASPKDGVLVTRDLPYGAHPRQQLDVFQPPDAQRAPVVVFVHGGAFLRGSRSAPEGIYDNVSYWFARQGCLGINMGYRLAPEAVYPSGAEDIAAAMAWIGQNAEEYGGDPTQIFLVGHSAGATHIAEYTFDPNIAVKPGPGLRGIVLISGRLRIDASSKNPNAHGVRAYFGSDEGRYESVSPVTHAHHCKHPVMIAMAEFENPLLDLYGAEFFWRLSVAQGKTSRFLRMARHNHSSMAMHFNTGEEILGMEILRFMCEHRNCQD